jgi:hypothetical protein
MPPDRDPLRVFVHALRAGDWRLAELLAARLFARPPMPRLDGAHRTFLRLRFELGI